MEDLAALAGVSPITVSRALRNSPLVTAQTREKVQRIADEQGYRLNVSARNLRLGRGNSVAVVVDMNVNVGRPGAGLFALGMLGGIMEVLTTAGYAVVLASWQLLDNAAVRGADGMIVLAWNADDEDLHGFRRLGLPLIACAKNDAGIWSATPGSAQHAEGALLGQKMLALLKSTPRC
jgi:DNA-binding LacI/PurR family transcriptional regulator